MLIRGLGPEDELLDYTYQTVCRRRPELCEPRAIKMVCFDADDTIWEITPHTIASNVGGPFKKIDDDTVEAVTGGYVSPAYPSTATEQPGKQTLVGHQLPQTKPQDKERHKAQGWGWRQLKKTSAPPKDRELRLISDELLASVSPIEAPTIQREPRRVTIKLKSTFRKTLGELDKKGIKSSIISLNTPGTVKRIIAAFGLTDRFTDIEDTWHNKGDVFASITERHKLNPCNALFIDDNLRNVMDVSNRGGLALVIGKGGDVQEPIELLKYVIK